MTDRPPWVTNHIADIALARARDLRTLARIREVAERAREAGLLLDPAEVEAVLDGAWCALCGTECGHTVGAHEDQQWGKMGVAPSCVNSPRPDPSETAKQPDRTPQW